MAKVSESIEIDAAPETCFKVITDYEKYPSFLKETKLPKEIKSRK